MWSERAFPQDTQSFSAEPASTKERQPRRSLSASLQPRLTKKELDLIDEALLPAQFLVPAHESLKLWNGERRLLFGVLEEAIRSFVQYQGDCTKHGKQLFRETCEWFWSTDRHWLYSFETICDYLHLDPDYLRRGLRHWQHAREAPKSSTHTRPREEATSAEKIYFRLGSGLRSRNFPGAGFSISPVKTRATKRSS
jgi:hypothetical protein